MNFPKVSIVFTNFNGGNEPIDLLRSIEHLNYPRHKVETIMVDNNSQDGSPQKIQQMFPNIIQIRNKLNQGFVEGINTGLKRATGEYVFIANDDIVFAANTIRALISYLLHHAGVGIIGCKIFYKDHPKQIASSGYNINKWTGHVFIAPHPSRLKEPDWIQGCGMLMPKKLLSTIGLLDTKFSPAYFEDTDLCFRTKEAGFKVVYYPKTHMWHRESITMNRNLSKKYYFWYRSKFRFMLKHFPIPNTFVIVLLHIFIIMPIRSILLWDGRLIPFLRGIIWNMTHIKETFQARSKIIL